MSRLWITPESSEIFYQTLERAASRQFIIEWSSQTEAEQAITDAFFAAASVTEISEGQDSTFNLDEERTLDAQEARLAAAVLTQAAGGERLIAADEARAAYDGLVETIGSMLPARGTGNNYCEYLIRQTSERASGWRRISDSMVAREIRGIFRNVEIQSIDPRPGLNPVDAVFAAFLLNFQAGGIDANIGWNDVMFTNGSQAVQSLINFYR